MNFDRLEEVQDETYGAESNPDWSVSRLQTIMSCGKQYHFKYITKTLESKTPPLAFGSAIHKCLEVIQFENRWDEPVEGIWAVEWFNAHEGIDWDSTIYRESTYYSKGKKIIEAFIAKHREDQWLGLETKFRFRPGNALPFLRGTFDKIQRLTEHPDIPPEFVGRVAIIDYKTSKNPPDPILLSVDPQLSIYHKAFKALTGEDAVLGLHHLPTDTIYWTTRKDQDFWVVEDMLNEGLERVEQEKWERNISWECKFCAFKNQCLGGLGSDVLVVPKEKETSKSTGSNR